MILLKCGVFCLGNEADISKKTKPGKFDGETQIVGIDVQFIIFMKFVELDPSVNDRKGAFQPPAINDVHTSH